MPGMVGFMVGLMQVYDELEDSAMVKEYFDRISKESPKTAQKYAFMIQKSEDGTRADDACAISDADWAEEEDF